MASSEVIRTRRFPISINSSISSEYQRIKLTGHSLNGSAENSHEKNNNRRGRQTNGSFEGNGFCRYQCKKYGEAGHTRPHPCGHEGTQLSSKGGRKKFKERQSG